MSITIELTPEEEACLHTIAMREGQDTASAAARLLRDALRIAPPGDTVQSAAEPESACEALKDFIGKFDSRRVRPEEQIPPSTDPQERAFGEILDEKYASLVTAAETLELTRVFTLDHHFYAYRTLDGNALEVVP